MSFIRRMFPAVVVFLASGCDPVPSEPARRGWLVSAIADDNRVWWSRDPSLLEHKFARMNEDPYDYVRATAGVFLADIARPGTERPLTHLLDDPAAWDVLLVGDPHPENLGTALPGSIQLPSVGAPPDATREVVVEFNDFDGSAFGPFTVDLRRAGVGLHALTWSLDGCADDCADRLVNTFAEAYRWEVESLAAGGAPTVDDALHRGAYLTDLVAEAEDEGPERKKTQKWASDGQLHRDASVVDGEGMVALTAAESKRADALLALLQRRVDPNVRILDVVRRYGSGVASLPAERLVVLWDLGAPGTHDDALLQLREVPDPSAIPGLRLDALGHFSSNATRIEQAPARLWHRPDVDPWNAGLSLGSLTYKATSWSSWHQDIDHQDIAEQWSDGELAEVDLHGIAELIGTRLAQAHARGGSSRNQETLPIIAHALARQPAAFSTELATTARHDASRAVRDHQHFRSAIADLGPDLGLQRLLETP